MEGKMRICINIITGLSFTALVYLIMELTRVPAEFIAVHTVQQVR